MASLMIAMAPLVAAAMGPGACMMTECGVKFASCELDKMCRQAVGCAMNCTKLELHKQATCSFMCEMTYGYGNVKYNNLMQCAANHNCIAPLPDDGNCRVGPYDGLPNLTKVEDIAGDWWVIRGLNPHYDSYACQHNRFVVENGDWHNHVNWNNTFVDPPVNVLADPIVTVPYPSYFMHNYTDIGMQPQIENWVVISKPHPEYMYMLWCGANPILKYAGGIVVSPHRTIAGIPVWVEDLFRKAAARFGIDYDKDMFINDNTNCP